MIIAFLLQRLLLHILLFFRHWYEGGLFAIYGRALGLIRKMERAFSIRINIHFLFSPLYQERNIYGYVIGFLFRGVRIVFFGAVYLIVFVLAVVVYFLWAAIPVWILYHIIVLAYGG